MNITNSNPNYTPSNLTVTSDPIAPKTNSLLTLPTELCYEIFKQLNLTDALVLKALCKKVSLLYAPYKNLEETCNNAVMQYHASLKEKHDDKDEDDLSKTYFYHEPAHVPTQYPNFLAKFEKMNDYFSNVLISQAKNTRGFVSCNDSSELLSAQSALEDLQSNNKIIRKNINKELTIGKIRGQVILPENPGEVLVIRKIIPQSSQITIIYTTSYREQLDLCVLRYNLQGTFSWMRVEDELLNDPVINPLNIDSKDKLLEYYKNFELEIKPKYGIFGFDLMPGHSITLESTEKKPNSKNDLIKLTASYPLSDKTKEMQSHSVELQSTMTNYYVLTPGVVMIHTANKSDMHFFRPYNLFR